MCLTELELAGLQYEHGQSGTMRPLQYAPVASEEYAEALKSVAARAAAAAQAHAALWSGVLPARGSSCSCSC